MFGAAVVVGAAVSLIGARVVQVHDDSGVWGLFGVSETPERIEVLGREYDRGDRPDVSRTPPGLVRHGETQGGGTILVPVDVGGTPVVIYVRDEDGQVWTYGLVGGP